MKTNFNFSDTALSKLTPRENRYHVTDKKCSGLTLRVTTAGKKIFYLRARVEGKVRSTKLSVFQTKHGGDIVTHVETARGMILSARTIIGQHGKEAQQEKRGYITLNDLVEEFLEVNPRDYVETTVYNTRKMYENHIQKKVGTMWFHEIRTEHVSKMRQKILKDASKRNGASGQRTWGQALSLLKILHVHAISFGHIESTHPKATDFVTPAKKGNGRTRFMDFAECRRFLMACDKYLATKTNAYKYVPKHRQTMVDCVKVCLFTGARSGNVKGMRWEDLDLNNKLWTIPMELTKTEAEYQIPLAPQAMEILLRRWQGRHDTFVFPGVRVDGPVVDLSKTYRKILGLAKLEGLTMHDLRRTQGSIQTELGVPTAMVGKMLCHADPKSTALYARSGNDAVRANLDRANRAMLGGKSDGAVDTLPVPVDLVERILERLGDDPLAAEMAAYFRSALSA